jgi:hypothetical protein
MSWSYSDEDIRVAHDTGLHGGVRFTRPDMPLPGGRVYIPWQRGPDNFAEKIVWSWHDLKDSARCRVRVHRRDFIVSKQIPDLADPYENLS